MSVFDVTNDIDALYQQDIHKNSSGFFVCPVCSKKYKTDSGIKKHMSEKDCYDIKSLLLGTQIEQNAHEFFQSMNDDRRISMFLFRRNNSYKSILKFILFCIVNEIQDVGLYFSYVDQIILNGKCRINKILSDARKVSMVRDYRVFLHKNPDNIDSDEFLERYRDDLIAEPKFLIRSIEKAHVAISVIIESGDEELLEAVNGLPQDYYNRLEDLYERIG